MTKCLILFFVLLTSMATASSESTTPQAKHFGLGLVLGSPTAITGDYWVNSKDSIDFGIGPFAPWAVLIYGDYLWHFPGAFGHGSTFVNHLAPYVGAGAGLYAWSGCNRPYGWNNYCSNSMGLYARVPLGIEWFAGRPPLAVFFELAPGISLIPGAWLILDIGLGARFYF